MRDIHFWWRMIRPHTLSASMIPVVVGTVYALQSAHLFYFNRFCAMLFASIFIQIATNLFNEYYDFIHGVDTPDSIGNSGTIVRDGASPRFVMAMALILYAVALLLGVYLCLLTSWWLAFIGAVCMLFGYLYGGGPYPISRTPFGELFAGGIMGWGIVMISFYVQTEFVTMGAFLVSMPVFILIGLILTSNSLRDRVNDIPSGRKTLAILLGHRRTVLFMTMGFIFAYLWLLVIVFSLNHHPILFLPLLSAPKAVESIQRFSSPKQTPAQMMPAMAATSKTNQLFGTWYTIAFLLEFLIALNLHH